MCSDIFGWGFFNNLVLNIYLVPTGVHFDKIMLSFCIFLFFAESDVEARRGGGGGVRVSSSRFGSRSSSSSYRYGSSGRYSSSARYSSTRIRVRTSRSYYSGYYGNRWAVYGAAGFVYGYSPYTRRVVYVNYGKGKFSHSKIRTLRWIAS